MMTFRNAPSGASSSAIFVATICATTPLSWSAAPLSEDEVVPFVVGRQMTQLAAQEIPIHRVDVDEAVICVDSAELLAPRRPQGLHGVGVPVEIDDPFVVGMDPVLGIGDEPDQISVVVEPHVFGEPDCADVDDRLPEEFQTGPLVVAQSAGRISAVVDRPVDVVGRDPDRLAQDGARKIQIELAQLRNAVAEPIGDAGRGGTVDAGHEASSCSSDDSVAARSGTLAPASSAITTYIFQLACRATFTLCEAMTPGLTSAPMSAGRQCM